MAGTFEVMTNVGVMTLNPLQIRRVEAQGINKQGPCKIVFEGKDKDSIVPTDAYEKVTKLFDEALRH